MPKYLYRIAGLSLDFPEEFAYLSSTVNYSPFFASSMDSDFPADIVFVVRNCEVSIEQTWGNVIGKCPCIPVIDNSTAKAYICEGFCYWVLYSEGLLSMFVRVAEHKPSKVEVFLDSHGLIDSRKTVFAQMMPNLFRNIIPAFNRLVLHAAAVDYEGRGIVFTGPSGAGKSTQACLWADEKGATIINHDRPVIQLEDKSPILHGAPWSGSIPCYRNQHVELNTIVDVVQSSRNQIRRLNKNETLERVLPRFSIPYWSDAYRELGVRTAIAILQSVTILELQCTEGPASVNILASALG